MAFANRIDVVRAVDRDYPGLIVRDPHSFTAIVAYRLWLEDPNWGHNVKRGNQGLSEDCICYLDDSSPLKVRFGPRQGRGIRVVDIIGLANTPNAHPAWLDQTLATIANGDTADWSLPAHEVREPSPRPPAEEPSTPPAPSGPDLGPVLAAIAEIKSELRAVRDLVEAVKADAHSLTEGLKQHVIDNRVELEKHHLAPIRNRLAEVKGCKLPW